MATRGQDWIWFHLSLIVQEENGEAFAASLRRLQQQVCKFGPDHFNAKKHPLLYFQVYIAPHHHHHATSMDDGKAWVLIVEAVDRGLWW